MGRRLQMETIANVKMKIRIVYFKFNKRILAPKKRWKDLVGDYISSTFQFNL